MNDPAQLAEELRAELIEMMWAYIETTKSGVIEWPPPVVDRQPTSVDWIDEKAILWEIAEHAHELCRHGGDAGGQSG
jgi:hypothetical protein